MFLQLSWKVRKFVFSPIPLTEGLRPRPPWHASSAQQKKTKKAFKHEHKPNTKRKKTSRKPRETLRDVDEVWSSSLPGSVVSSMRRDSRPVLPSANVCCTPRVLICALVTEWTLLSLILLADFTLVDYSQTELLLSKFHSMVYDMSSQLHGLLPPTQHGMISVYRALKQRPMSLSCPPPR